MKEFLIKHKRLLIDIVVLTGIFFYIFFSYFIFKPLFFVDDVGFGSTNGVIPRVYIYLCLLGVIGVGVFLKIKNHLSVETALFLIFLIGVIMQLNYMLITPYNYRQHDVFSYNLAGHQGYALTIYKTGALPTQVDENGYLDYQFYHPPFNAFMQSLMMNFAKPFMRFVNFITGTNYYDVQIMDNFTMDKFEQATLYLNNRNNNPSYNTAADVAAWEAAYNYARPVNLLYQTSEILATFYMNIAIYFAIRTAYRLKVESKYKVIGAVFVSLFPALMILAGQENNDPLCIMNCFIVIYYTVCWYESRSYFNAIMIGLFTGLAMFAKLSGALIIIPAIVMFAYALILSIIKKESFKHILIQGAIIGVIAAPLGLWFHIYAKVKFNQPFGFVFANLNSNLYTGDHSFFERFINIFDFADMSTALWGNTFVNYNLPNFLIKSALFGEYSFMCADEFGFLALIFNYLFVYASLALMIIYFIYSKKEHLEIKIIGGVIVLTQLLAQLYFNIKMPYGCTMDFRYIVPIILGFMILDVLAFDKFNKEKSWRKYLSTAVLVLGALLIGSISLFYLTAI